MSSGGLAVKHPALGANGHRFKPSKRSKPFQGLFSRLTTLVGWWTTLKGADVSIELLKIKGALKKTRT